MKLFICLEICLYSRFMSIVLWPEVSPLVPFYLKMHIVGEEPGITLSVWGISFIRLAACYQVYNALLKTSKGALFLSPSEVYVRSFLYPIYTLIKLYYKNSSEWSSLVSGSRLKSSLRPRIPDLLTAHGSNLSELYLCVTGIIYFYLN